MFIVRFFSVLRIIGLLSIAVALSACSAIKLGYNTLPQVSMWWIDSYLDLGDDQEQRVREDFARLHQWHRTQELPKIAALLRQAERMAATADLTPPQICAMVPTLRSHALTAAERAEPPAVTLALSLSPEQIAHLERKYQKNNREYRKDWVELSPDELLDKRYRQYLDRVEMIYGRLDAAQREVLRSQVERSSFSALTNLGERERRQQEILQALRKLSGQPVSLADARATLHRVVEGAMQSPDARYRRYQDTLIDEGCRNLAAVHQGTTPQQRQSAVRRLRAYQRDLQELASEP